MGYFFSIIIPTYNSAKVIEAAIQSVLNQNYQNFELIIIDGLSTDDTSIIVKSFDDKRIQFTSEKDNGVYYAMNKGIDMASGEYIYFLGSDDTLFNSDVLQVLFKSLSGKPFDLIYGNVLFTSSKEIYAGEFTLDRLLYVQNISHQAIFYRKDCFNKLGKYNLKYKLLADWDFNVRCFMHPDFEIKFIDITISNYNDATGLSKDTGESDQAFMKIMPYFKLRELKSELSSMKYSREYRLGNLIYKPFKKVISLFTKKEM